MSTATIGAIYVAARDGLIEKTYERDQYTCFTPKFSENAQGSKFVSDVFLNNYEFVRILQEVLGFYRYNKSEHETMLVRIQHNTIQEASSQMVVDAFKAHLYEMPTDHYLYHAFVTVYNKFANSIATWFNKDKLNSLLYKADYPIIFNTDTENEAYFYFKNGFVVVTKEGYVFKTYDKMPTVRVRVGEQEKEVTKVIWKNQILPHNFTLKPKSEWEKSDWYLFAKNISQADMPERVDTLLTLSGYLLHGFMGKKRKAIIATDSTISVGAEGRSGKTLWGRGLAQLLNGNANAKLTEEINGKDFNPTNEFRWQMLGLETRLVILNDVKKRFKFDVLFNDISDGLERQRKNETPTKLQVKMYIPTNETIELPTGSYKDRAIEFEFSSHYNAKHQPSDEFSKWFFTDWDADDWACFHNTMLYGVMLFLKNGLPKEVKSINLEKRKLLDETNSDFLDYMDYRFHSAEAGQRIILNDPGQKEYGVEKNQLYNDFIAMYPEAQKSVSSNYFKRCLDKYVLYNDWIDSISQKKNNTTITLFFHRPATQQTEAVQTTEEGGDLPF